MLHQIKRRGFTLIELLVVIAIIAVLIALLAAGRPGRAGGGPPRPVHQQPEADRPGDAQLSPDQQQVPPGPLVSRPPSCRPYTGYAGWTEWSASGGDAAATWSSRQFYNAINFSFCGGYGIRRPCQPHRLHGTVINSIHVPVGHQRRTRAAPPEPRSGRSRGVGQQRTYPPNINSYRGSIGTTTTSTAGVSGLCLRASPTRSTSLRRNGGRRTGIAVLDGHLRVLDLPTASRTSPTARPTRSPSPSRWSATHRNTGSGRHNNNSVTNVTAASIGRSRPTPARSATRTSSCPRSTPARRPTRPAAAKRHHDAQRQSLGLGRHRHDPVQHGRPAQLEPRGTLARDQLRRLRPG